jgi:hypothetical protein
MSNRWTLVGIAVIVVAGIWFWTSRRTVDIASIDLVQAFDAAEKRTDRASLEQAFSVQEVDIGGTTKRAIYAHPTSRIIWRLEIPDGAWLRTSLGLKPEVWDQEGDGVLFRIGVSDGRVYEELLNQLVDPIGNLDDRRWIPVVLDLSGYGGTEVEVIFNTNTGLPGTPDSRYDWAVWGEPEIYVE